MKNFEVLRQKICELYGIDEKGITENTSFIEDLQVDSLDMAELAIMLEDTYNITIKDEQLEDMRTLGDVANFIKLTHCAS